MFLKNLPCVIDANLIDMFLEREGRHNFKKHRSDQAQLGKHLVAFFLILFSIFFLIPCLCNINKNRLF